jgi:exodeoxyribonuclease VII small subunit
MAKKIEVDGRTIEEKLRRLEEIGNQLDRGSIPLEEQLKVYEEGVLLARACREYIENAQAKVTELGRVLLGPTDAASGPE